MSDRKMGEAGENSWREYGKEGERKVRDKNF